MSAFDALGEFRCLLILSAHSAGMQIVAYGLRTRFFVLFWLIFAKAKIKKGIPCPAGHGSGRCPENPQTFEKV